MRLGTRMLAFMLACVTVGLLAAFCPARALAAEDGGQVVIELPDGRLHAAVVAQLDAQGVAYETDGGSGLMLAPAELARVHELNLSNAAIEDLSGIEAFGSLTSLSAYGNRLGLDGIKPVAQLARLRSLDLSRNLLTDLEGAPASSVTATLSALTELRELDLSHCLLRYTTGLAALTKLERLDLFDNAIRDLSGLAAWSAGDASCALPGLRWLSLGENNERKQSAMVGLDALATLGSLEYLDFSCNGTPEVLDRLSGLTQLRFLQLQGNSVTSLEALAGLAELRTLVASHNSVASVGPLLGLSKLEELYLHANALYAGGAAGLAGCFGEEPEGGTLVWPQLRKLDISGNHEWTPMHAAVEISRLFEFDQAGSIELGYDYDFVRGYDALAANDADGTHPLATGFGNTPTASLPHVDAGGVAYVSYDDFGARCDGVHDDFNAMANAHRFANAHGCEVRATAGRTYHVFRYYDSTWYDAYTDVDWCGATIVVHDEDIEDKNSRHVPLLCLRPSRRPAGAGVAAAYDDVVTMPTAASKTQEAVPAPDVTLTRGTTRLVGAAFQAELDKLAAKGYERFYVAAYNADTKQYIRFGSNANSGSEQWDGVIVDATGTLVTDADDPYRNRPQWDFSEITRLVITPIPTAQAHVRNATFHVNAFAKPAEVVYGRGGDKPIYYYRNLQVRDCANVAVSGITQQVSDGGRLSGSYYGFLEVRDAAEMLIEDCDLFSHKFGHTARSTYGLIINRTADVLVRDVINNGVDQDDPNADTTALVETDRWGVTGNNHCKDITYDHCTLNRIDAHEGYYNLRARDCLVGCKAFTLTGQGPFAIERCRVMAENLIVLRQDYGSTWDTWDALGRIVDCTLEYHGRWSQNLVAVTGSFDSKDATEPHDFGYPCRFPNLYVHNLTIDERAYDPANDRETFTVIPNSRYEGNRTFELPAAYWPQGVTVNGVTLTGYEETMGHAPYLRLVDTAAGGIMEGAASRNFLVSDARVRLGGAEGKDVTERLFCDVGADEPLTTDGPVWVSVRLDGIVSNGSGATIARSARLERDGHSIDLVPAADGSWERSLAEPGSYRLTLRSEDGVGGWVGERTLAFAIAPAADAEPATRLLLTRTVALGQGAASGFFSMSPAELSGREITVRFTGATPGLRLRQEGTGAGGTRAWLYFADVAASSVEELGGGSRLAHFSAADVAAAWERAVAYADAKDDAGTVVIERGDYGRMLVRAANGPCTFDRVALVGGAQAVHVGGYVTVAGRTAGQIVEEMRVGWNLGNALDAYLGTDDGPLAELDRADLEAERAWSNPPATPELIQFVQDAGFNAVRVPVTWFQHVYEKDGDPYHIDEAWLARVREVVDYCYDRGLYVILDLHHEKTWIETPRFGDADARPQMVAQLTALWRQIAEEFASYDQRLVFEGLNEPRAAGEGVSDAREWGSPTAGDIETLNQLNQAFVDAVRSVASPYRTTRLLLAATPSGATDLHAISQLALPDDAFVGVYAHPYVPYDFTAQTDERWAHHVFDAQMDVALEQTLFRMYATFASRGVPVVLDEFNAQDFGNTAERVAWARRYLALARGWGMACFLWDNGGDAGVVNAAGNETGYVDRWAAPPTWKNERQEAVAKAIVAAAGDESVAWGSVRTPVADGSAPTGRALTSAPLTLAANTRSSVFAVRWEDLAAGDVAVQFVGSRAPSVVLTDAAGGGWTLVDPSYVAWNEGATAGVAYFWPEHLRRRWTEDGSSLAALSAQAVSRAAESLRQLRLSANADVTVESLVLTGAAAAPDVSNGGYGDAAQRLVLRRPDVSIISPAPTEGANRTLRVELRGEPITGSDLAVRYVGATPELWLTDHAWKCSASIRPYLDVVVPDEADECVAFFHWSDATDAWAAKSAGTGYTADYLDLRVSGGTAAAPRTCKVVEVVELGGTKGASHATGGTALLAGATTLTQGSDNSRRVSLSPRSGSEQLWRQTERGVIWPAVAGREIAVSFTGDIPYLWLASDLWEGWPTIESYEVAGDPKTGAVAYFPAANLKAPWLDRSSSKLGRALTTDDLTVIFATSGGTTTITDARLLEPADPAHVHDWGAWTLTTAPTCTEPGVETRTCKDDATHAQTRQVDPLGHDWQALRTLDVAPTCTEPGESSVHCARCDERTQVEEVAALGHVDDGGRVVREATPATDGATEHRCTVCGALLAREAAPARIGTSERVLYSRTVTLGGAQTGEGWSYPVPTLCPLTPADVAGSDVCIRFFAAGSVPKLYLLERDARGSWLYKVSLEASAVDGDEDGDGWAVAAFTSADIAAAWERATAEAGAQGGAVPRGAYTDVFVSKVWEALAPATFERVTLVSAGAPERPESAPVTGRTAGEIVEAMGVGWNLGNSLDSHYVGTPGAADGGWGEADLGAETLWHNPRTTRALVKAVKAAGFSTIRVPVTWYQHLHAVAGSAYGEDTIDEAWLGRVREVVDWCYDEGLFVILDLHHEAWIDHAQFGDAAELAVMRQRLAAIWRQLATEFADYDQRLVFEAMNEPRATGDGVPSDREWGTPSPGDVANLNALNQAFVDAVRQVGGAGNAERLLMVPTNSAAAGSYATSQLALPTTGGATDAHLAVSVHAYEPQSLTGTTDAYQDASFDATDEAALERVMYGLWARFSRLGVPVVIGEFGCADHDNAAERAAWAKRYVGLATQAGAACLLWDGGDAPEAVGMRYFDRAAATLVDEHGQAGIVRAATAARAAGAKAWNAGFSQAVPEGAPAGLQLNADAFELGHPAANVGAFFSAGWEDVSKGPVAVTFSGDAPKLTMADANTGGWCDAAPSYVAWGSWGEGMDRGGVAYFWPDQLAVEWAASGREVTELGTLAVRSFGTTTVDRVVLTGIPALALAGGYGTDGPVRPLYTRPVALARSPEGTSDAGDVWNTVAINVENPTMAGADIAVRHTGDAPSLVLADMLSDHGWHGWTTVRPSAVAQDEATGERVALFRRADLERGWALQRARDGRDWAFDTISVAVSRGQGCQIVEVVALGGEPRAPRPTMRQASESLGAPQLVSALKAGYNLAGHFESTYVSGTVTKDGGWGDADLDLEAHWSRGAYVARQTVRDLRLRGFRTIRLPVTWFQHLYQVGEGTSDLERYHIDRAWLARVHEVVDWCLAEDLYVIVNLHHEDWIDRADLDRAYDESDLPQKFAAVWTQIAREFDGYDQRLVFESMNEPHAAGDPTDREWNQPNAGDVSTVNRLNQDFVNLMRGLGTDDPASRHGERLLMVPPFAASTAEAATAGFVVPSDPAGLTAVSLHNYAPYAYTHFGNKLTLGSLKEVWDQNVFTGDYRDQLWRSFERIRARFTDRGVPVVLGEFGSFYCGEARQADRLAWMDAFATYAKELGIPAVYWRMDKTDETANRTVWSVYDEVEHGWSDQSKALIDRWFAILDDPDVGFSSRATIAADEHAALEEGKRLALSQDSRHIYQDGASGSVSWHTNSPAVTPADFAECELAVRFTGATPRIALMDEHWNGWTYVEPFYVAEDLATGTKIAYFAERSVGWLWDDVRGTSASYTDAQGATHSYELGDFARLCIATQGVGTPEEGGTWIDEAVLVGVHRHSWGAWAPVAEPTCTEPGEQRRTCVDDERHVEVRAVAPLGHAWGEPSYAWSDDDASVTATAVCARCGERLVETVRASSEVSVAPGFGTPGTRTLTAIFAGAPFATQTREVEIEALEKGERALGVRIAGWTYGAYDALANAPQVTGNLDVGEARFSYKPAGADDAHYAAGVPTDAGRYTLRVQVVEGETLKAGEATVDFAVAPAKITIAATDASSAYGSPPPELGYTVSGGHVVTDELGVRLSCEAGPETPVGRYPIKVAWNGNPNYEATLVEGVYTVTAGRLSVVARGYAGAYDGRPHAIDVAVAGGEARVWYATAAPLTADDYATVGTTTPPTRTDAGITVVHYYVAGPNHEHVAGTQRIEISAAPLDVVAGDARVAYGDAAPAPEDVTVRYLGLVSGEGPAALLGTLSLDVGGYAAGMPAGSYPLTPGGLSSDNYDLRFVSGTLAVEPRAAELSWSGADLVYSGEAQGVSATVANRVGDDDVAVLLEGASAVRAGSYVASAVRLLGPDAGNYALPGGDARTRAWHIAQADNVVGVAIDGWTYGTTASAPVASARFGAQTATFEYADAAAGPWDGSLPTEAGRHWVRAHVAGTDDYAGATSEPLEFSIAKAKISPAVSVTGWRAGEAPSAPQVTGNPGGGAVSLSYKEERADDAAYASVPPSVAGSYTVRATVAETANYLGGSATASFVVTGGEIRDETVGSDNWGAAVASGGDAGLAGAVPLTQRERSRVAAGERLGVRLAVSWLSPEAIPERDLPAALGALGGRTVGAWLDVSVFKQLGGDADATRVTERLGYPVSVRMVLPQDLRAPAGVGRSWAVVRVHDGAATLLDATFDAANAALSFSSDLFSTYALVYRDDAPDAGGSDGHDVTGGSGPKATGATATTAVQRGGVASGEAARKAPSAAPLARTDDPAQGADPVALVLLSLASLATGVGLRRLRRRSVDG